MKEIYLLIIEDRHENVQIYPYTTYKQAEINFNDYIENSSRVDKDIIEKCTKDAFPNPLHSSLLKAVAYSEEGDYVYITKKTLDENLYED